VPPSELAPALWLASPNCGEVMFPIIGPGLVFGFSFRCEGRQHNGKAYVR
jgi:hypothetical protein